MKVQKAKMHKLFKLNGKGLTEFNKELKDLNTFKISGKAKFYLEINTIENCVDVINYLLDCREKIFVLGGGSNILVEDYFDGAIIKLNGNFAHIEMVDGVVEMGAGVALSSALQFCIKNNLSGFEESIGVPGTIGGATYMNASCFDFEMAKIVSFVVALDLNSQKIVFLDNKDCNFGYRTSIFQNNQFIILRVGFSLKHANPEMLELKKKDTLEKRLKSQPKGYSAGSVFKRINDLNVSKMLDDMGIKGWCIGDAEVSTKHANFILNKGNATSIDVKNLIEKIEKEFKNTYNLQLQREIKYLE